MELGLPIDIADGGVTKPFLAFGVIDRRSSDVVANGLASAILVLWGGANILVGALVLGGVLVPSATVDEHALRWHVFVWDLWFLAWGVVLAVAVAGARRGTH